MKKKKDYNLLIGFVIISGTIIFITFTLLNVYSNKQEKECYREAVELFNSVNKDNVTYINIQEGYDINNRQACASFYYIGCINNMKVNCAETQEEKLNRLETTQ